MRSKYSSRSKAQIGCGGMGLGTNTGQKGRWIWGQVGRRTRQGGGGEVIVFAMSWRWHFQLLLFGDMEGILACYGWAGEGENNRKGEGEGGGDEKNASSAFHHNLLCSCDDFSQFRISCDLPRCNQSQVI